MNKIKFQISNFKFQILDGGPPASQARALRAGFSLIELLVVMATFIVTSSVIANVVLLYVKSVDKTNAETAIRQTGNGIISQMAKDIRNAGDVECPAGDDKTLIITPKLTPAAVITYYCDITNKKIQKTIAPSAAVYLTDSSKISLTTCAFSCTDPIYTVSFNLKEARRSIGVETEIPFQTSVQKRNK